MAILTDAQRAELRQAVATDTANGVDWTKPQINLATQAVEDAFETTVRQAFADAIELAVPGVFNAAKKRRIVKHWLRQKFGRE